MKIAVLAAAVAAALSLPAFADTRMSEQAPVTQEHRSSPSHPTKQEEEQTEAHSQPNSHPSASSSSGASTDKATDKPAKKSGKKKQKNKADKPSSSSGASRPQSALTPEKEQAFRALDLDGDGKVALSEAAGNAGVVMGFDRADRNRDGQLDRGEFARLGQKPKRARTASSRASR